MTDKNTPNTWNGREIRPNPTHQSFPKTASIPDSSQSKYNLLNRDIGILDNMQLANIQVRDKIMIIWVAEDVITILGYINTEIDTPEQVVPMVLLWSQLFDAYYQEIRDEISCRFDIAISDLSIQYMWLNRDNFSKSNFDLTDDELWELPDFYNDMDEEFLEKKTMQSFKKNTILFDPDYLEEGMSVIKIWETEYIYELLGDTLEVKVKIDSYLPDGSLYGVYLLEEEIKSKWPHIVEKIASLEWYNIEDIHVYYASMLGVRSQDQFLKQESSRNDRIIEIEKDIFILWKELSIQDFSQKGMKIYSFWGVNYVYKLNWTTIYLYWVMKYTSYDMRKLDTFLVDKDSKFLIDLVASILKEEWLSQVKMDALFKLPNNALFEYIGHEANTRDSLSEWLSTNKTTLN